VTRPSIEVRILGLYTAGREAEAYTISEIARKVKAAYPHVHAAVQTMADQGLLRIRQAGKASICTADLTNGIARALILQAHLRDVKPTQSALAYEAEIRRLAEEPCLIAAIRQRERLFFIVTDHSRDHSLLKKTPLLNISFLTPEQLSRLLLSLKRGEYGPLDGSEIILGYERLLLTIAPIQERLMLNRAAVFREVRR